MRRKIVLTAITATSMMTVGNFGNVYAGSIQSECKPLLSASYIISGNVGSCVDPLVEICEKLGIEFNNGVDCPVIVVPGICNPEVEITTEADCNIEEICPETGTEEDVTTEVVTTQSAVPEISTTEPVSEIVTEVPNIPETTKVPETTKPEVETTQKPATKPENETTQQVTTKPEYETTQQATTKPGIDIAPEETTVSVALSYAEQVVNLVNVERQKAGLKALTLDKNIETAALIRAKETEISFSHTRPNGSSFSTVLRENGISFRGAGENIAWGQRSPEQVMNGWMNSSGHRANILNPNFTKIGVGYYKSETGRQYWTQLFTY